MYDIAITDLGNNNILNQITKYILLSLDLETSDIHYMQWKVSITPSIGIMKVFDIIAHINKKTVELISKSVTATQQIPPLYETKEQCTKSGSQRYGGVLGPRKKVCKTYTVARGINSYELNFIAKRLSEKIQHFVYSM